MMGFRCRCRCRKRLRKWRLLSSAPLSNSRCLCGEGLFCAYEFRPHTLDTGHQSPHPAAHQTPPLVGGRVMAAVLPRVRAGAALLGRPGRRPVGEVGSLLSQPPAVLARQLLAPPGPAARQRVLLELAAAFCHQAPTSASTGFFPILENTACGRRRAAGTRLNFQVSGAGWPRAQGSNFKSSHCTRRTCTARALANGLRTVQTLGGHASPCARCAESRRPCPGDGLALPRPHLPALERARASPWCAVSPREMRPNLDTSRARRYRSVSETTM